MNNYKNTNSVYFSAAQVTSGTMNDFLLALYKQCYADDSSLYNDIHIYPADLGAFIVEWVQIPWDDSYGGGFVYVSEDQVVFTEHILPDNSVIALPADEDFNEYLERWLGENPGWKRTSYGTWTNTIENQKFKEALEKEAQDRYKKAKEELGEDPK